MSSSSATARSWPCRILMSARCSRSLAMATAWEPTSPADSGSEGLCPTATLDVAVAAGEPQVGVEAFDRLDAEAQLFPRFVADHDAPVAADRRAPACRGPSCSGRAGRCRPPRRRAVRAGTGSGIGSGPASQHRWWCGRRTGRRGRRRPAGRGRRGAAGSRRGNACSTR